VEVQINRQCEAVQLKNAAKNPIVLHLSLTKYTEHGR